MGKAVVLIILMALTVSAAAQRGLSPDEFAVYDKCLRAAAASKACSDWEAKARAAHLSREIEDLNSRREREAADARRRSDREAAAATVRKAHDALLKAGQIFIGASKDEVAGAWGAPVNVRRSTTSAGVIEAWSYDGNRLVVFEHNAVTQIDE